MNIVELVFWALVAILVIITIYALARRIRRKRRGLWP